MSMTDPECAPRAPAQPMTVTRLWTLAGAHAEAARLRLTGPAPVDHRGARAHAELAQAYAQMLAAVVASHPPGASALRALTMAAYDPDEV